MIGGEDASIGRVLSFVRSFVRFLPRARSVDASDEDEVSGGVQRRAGGWMGVRVGASGGSDDDGGDDDGV